MTDQATAPSNGTQAEMTARDALTILDQATAQLNAPRAAHVQIAQALKVLERAITPDE